MCFNHHSPSINPINPNRAYPFPQHHQQNNQTVATLITITTDQNLQFNIINPKLNPGLEPTLHLHRRKFQITIPLPFQTRAQSPNRNSIPKFRNQPARIDLYNSSRRRVPLPTPPSPELLLSPSSHLLAVPMPVAQPRHLASPICSAMNPAPKLAPIFLCTQSQCRRQCPNSKICRPSRSPSDHRSLSLPRKEERKMRTEMQNRKKMNWREIHTETGEMKRRKEIEERKK